MKKLNKKFKFSREEATFIAFVIMGFIIISEYFLATANITISKFLLLNLLLVGMGAIFTFFYSVFYCDVIIKESGLEIKYIGWYLFRIPKKVFLPFNQIKKINRTSLHPTYANVVISTRKSSVVIYYTRLNNPPQFLELLHSKAPKNTQVIGFERSKEGKLKW